MNRRRRDSRLSRRTPTPASCSGWPPSVALSPRSRASAAASRSSPSSSRSCRACSRARAIDALLRGLGTVRRDTKIGCAGVHVSFPLVRRRFPLGGRPVSRVPCPRLAEQPTHHVGRQRSRASRRPTRARLRAIARPSDQPPPRCDAWVDRMPWSQEMIDSTECLCALARECRRRQQLRRATSHRYRRDGGRRRDPHRRIVRPQRWSTDRLGGQARQVLPSPRKWPCGTRCRTRRGNRASICRMSKPEDRKVGGGREPPGTCQGRL